MVFKAVINFCFVTCFPFFLLCYLLASCLKLSQTEDYSTRSVLHIREFAVAICRKNLLQELVVKICRDYLLWVFCICKQILFCICEEILFIWKQTFLYVSKTFLSIRFSLLTVFLLLLS